MSVTDVAANSDTISVTLAVVHGILDISPAVPGGVGAGSITGNGTGSVTLTGTQAAIDTTLGSPDGVIYLANTNFTGSDTLTMTSSDQGNGSLTAQSTVAINVTPTPDPHLWSNVLFPLSPTTGVHLFNPGLAVNPLNGIVGLDYESTTNFNPANLTVPLQFTQQIAGFHPFFLPELIGNPVIAISDIIPPTRQTFFLPNILANGKVDTEVVDNFVSQDAGGNDVVNQTIITGGNNDNTLNIPLPTIVESVGQSVIYNLRSSFRQDNSTTVGTTTLPYLSSYDLAWDQYSSASQVFKINFQIFDATGAATSSVITPVSLSNVADILLAPAWNFGSGGAGSSICSKSHSRIPR